MALSFVSAGSEATGANPTVTVPGTYAAGDILLLITCGSANSTTPTGWTLVGTKEGAGQFICVYQKYAAASESSVAVTQAGTTSKAVMLAYRGGGAFEVIPAFTTGTGTTATPSSLTTTYANDFVINIYASANVAQTWTANGSTTSRFNSAATSSVRGLLIADETQAAAGASTARGATLSTSNTWASLAIGLIPTRSVYWVGGAGTWDISSTTNWADSTGGASGKVAPSAYDNAVIDPSSGTGTITCNSGICGNLTVTATQAIILGNASSTLSVYGSLTYPSGGSFSGSTNTWTITLAGTTTGRTITGNGKIINTLTINGVGGYWTLGSNFSTNNVLTIIKGTLDTSATNYSLGLGGGTSLNLNGGTLTLNASNVNITGTSPKVNLNSGTLNAGTSTFVLSTTTTTLNVNGYTLYNISSTATSSTTQTISGGGTCNNLTMTPPSTAGISILSFGGDFTINGALSSTAADATRRLFFRSNTLGTQRTLTCNGTTSLTDVDFRDIAVIGTASPISGTRFSDCKGNSGITFPAAKTVYCRATTAANWGSNSWSATAGGGANLSNFPLAQDTAVFPSSPTPYPNSGVTFSINAPYNIGTIDMSARTTNTMTLSMGVCNIYGDFIGGTGVTHQSGINVTFAGRNTQNITSAGKTITWAPQIDTLTGTVKLVDDYTGSYNGANFLVLLSGTFDCNGKALVATGTDSRFQTSGSISRTFAFSGSTVTIAGSGGWNAASATGLTITGSGTLSLTNASAKPFAGGGADYSGITLDNAGAGALTISGSNTIGTISNSVAPTTFTFTSGTTQTVTDFNVNGTSGNLVTIGATTTSAATLSKSSGIVSVSYCTISYSTATGGASWQAYTTNGNVDGGNNTGWIFNVNSGNGLFLGSNGLFFGSNF